MDIGGAVSAMKQGKKVRRPVWHDKSTTVTHARFVAATEFSDEYIEWILNDGKRAPMTFSHSNILADDWEIVPE